MGGSGRRKEEGTGEGDQFLGQRNERERERERERKREREKKKETIRNNQISLYKNSNKI